MAYRFKIRDIVSIKTGTRAGTVNRTSASRVSVAFWDEKKGKMCVDHFAPGALELYADLKTH